MRDIDNGETVVVVGVRSREERGAICMCLSSSSSTLGRSFREQMMQTGCDDSRASSRLGLC